MPTASTERHDERDASLDLWPTAALVARIVEAQHEALRTIEPRGEAIAMAVEALAAVLRAGGRMAFAGAGSSGLLVQLEALELPGTFGIPAHRVPVVLAGGDEALRVMPGGAEDDAAAAEAAVEALDLGAGDALVATSASGSTPFTVAALRRARRRGAVTVGIACVAASPLLAGCDHPILVETPPEVVAGSTRMGAGTAQKCVLNILSTGVAVRLGHVYRGLMVNMHPDNTKLRTRAVAIVAEAAGIGQDEARRHLAEAAWSIKTAILAGAAALPAVAAQKLLAASGNDIRAALAGRPATHEQRGRLPHDR